MTQVTKRYVRRNYVIGLKLVADAKIQFDVCYASLGFAEIRAFALNVTKKEASNI